MYIGTTIDDARASCRGCALLAIQGKRVRHKAKRKKRGCYAYASRVHRGYRTLSKLADTSLQAALYGRMAYARFARISAIGDASALSIGEWRRTAAALAAVKLRTVGYTHFWRSRMGRRPLRIGTAKYNLVRRHLMASCDSWQEVTAAIRRGWSATLIVDPSHPAGVTTLPGGEKGILCPNQICPEVCCNDCGLCCPEINRQRLVILFRDHGPTTR